MTAIATLYKWFSDLKKPNGAQFRALIDSFFHKSEKIPMSSIDGLDRIIEGTASAQQLQNHINDTHAHKEVLDKKVDKVPGKKLSTEDFTTELRQKLEGLQQVDTSGLLPKGGYTGTAQDLKNLIDGLTRILQSPDTELDELREIVAYIKQNKHILSTLGINNIAGLEEALAAKADKNHHHDERYAPKEHHHNEYAYRTHRHNKDDIDGLPANIATTENVKTAIDGIQIGGRNYWLNSSFVNKRYMFAGNGITIIDKNSESLTEIHTIKPNENWTRITTNPTGLDLLENKEVTLSFDIKVLEGELGCPNFYAGAFTPYMEMLPVLGKIELNKWTRVYKTFISRKDWTIHLGFSHLSGKYQFRNFKLEIGNKPTDWTPAIEDLKEFTNTKINDISIGGRNYILNSKPRISETFTVYGTIKWIYLSQRLKINETYILTANNYKNAPKFFLWNDNGWGEAREIKIGEPFVAPLNYEKICIHTQETPFECDIEMLKLERGNKATDWTPAPEDLQERLNGYEVSANTALPATVVNDTVFANAVVTLGLENIPNKGSVSLIKTFDNGAVSFTCVGKTIVYPNDNIFNGKEGSTAVVSVYNNKCYIRISNV